MSQYLKTYDSDGNMYFVEIDDIQDESTEVTSGKLVSTKIENTIDDALRVAKTSIAKLRDLKADEVEVEFGVKVGVESGVSFWAISKASGEANITIKAKWTKEHEE